MNVSLTPNDTVGRMLHTFNCTAYEVAECTHENMLKYGTLDLPELQDKRTRWGTRELVTFNGTTPIYFNGEVLNSLVGHAGQYVAKTALFTGFKPGDYFYLNVPEDISVSYNTQEAEPYKVVIGATGSFYVEGIGEIRSIIIPPGAKYTGTVTFSYEGSYPNTFSLVSDINVEDVPLQLIIPETNKRELDIKSSLEDLKTKIYDFVKIKLIKRPIYTIYSPTNSINKNNLYWNKDKNDAEEKVDLNHLDPYGIYKIRLQTENGSTEPEGFHFNEDMYLKEHYETAYPFLGKYLLGNSQNLLDESNYSTICQLNGANIDVKDSRPFIARDMKLTDLIIGSGVYFEASYVKHVLSYYLEEDNVNTRSRYEAYLSAKEKYEQAIASADGVAIEEKARGLESAYRALLVALEEAIAQYNKEHGYE